MSVKRVEVPERTSRDSLRLPLLSCESWMFVKVNPGRKKKSKPRIDPVGIYLLKLNNRNTRIRCGIYSKLTIKTGFVLISFLLILNTPVLVFQLLTLNRQMATGREMVFLIKAAFTNPFHNLWFTDVFKGYIKRPMSWNGLTLLSGNRPKWSDTLK